MGSTVFPAAGGGVTPKVQTFTSTGTFTAPSNTTYVEVFLVGGGGGGGAGRYNVTTNQSLGGGGGGGNVIQWRKLAVTGGTAYTVTIGAGGSGATSDAVGADGSDTTFGSLATAYGGGGGGTCDSGNNLIYPRIRGTAGGIPRNSASFATAGGGAASLLLGGSGTSPFGSVNAAQSWASINGVMAGGFVQAPVNTYNIPGPGIDGYGGGGWGAQADSANTWNNFSVHGGAIGVSSGNAAGPAANANTGGGGSGGIRTSSGRSNGGNGGSGYAIVVYWS